MKITGELQKLAVGILAQEQPADEEMADVDTDNLPTADQILFRQRSDRCRFITEQFASIISMIESLDIVSPAKGQISKAFVRSAQSLQQGTAVATVTPSTGTWVVVYSRDQGILRLAAGMPVTVSLLRDPRNPRVEEWGRPMRIAVPANVEISPGSLVSVAFDVE